MTKEFSREAVANGISRLDRAKMHGQGKAARYWQAVHEACDRAIRVNRSRKIAA